MNINNPYSELIKEMRKHGQYYNPSPPMLGTVITSSPLTVKIGDLQLNNNNLLVADYLLLNYSRDLQANGTTQTYTTQNGLNQDDLVVLIQVNDATFIILCKVVSV